LDALFRLDGDSGVSGDPCVEFHVDRVSMRVTADHVSVQSTPEV